MSGAEAPGLAVAAEAGGADVIELGFPFSDPLADGPVIRRAAERALAEGMRTRECLECLARTRERVPDRDALVFPKLGVRLSYAEFDRKVREAARGLLRLGKSALPAIEKAARDADGEVAARAAHLIRAIRWQETLSPALRKKYPGIEEQLDGAPRVATKVFLDLHQPGLGDDEPPLGIEEGDLKALARLAVQGAVGEEIYTVSYWIQSRRLTQAAPDFIPLLSHPDTRMRGLAASCLGDLGHRAAIPGIFKLLEDASGNTRSIAADALIALRAREVAPFLRPQLKHSDADIRSRAAELLGEFEDRESIPDLLAIVRASKERESGTLGALCKMRVAEAAPHLVAILKSGSEHERAFALNGLIAIRSKEAVPSLLLKTKDGESWIRGWAAQSLGEIGDPATIPALAVLLDDPVPFVTGSALMALTSMRSKDHFLMAARWLKEGDSNEKWFVVRGLGNGGSREHVKDILPLLHDRDVPLCWASIQALAQIGDPEALPELRKLLQAPLPRSRELAQEAIRAIEGRR